MSTPLCPENDDDLYPGLHCSCWPDGSCCYCDAAAADDD